MDTDNGDSQYLDCVCKSSDASCNIGPCASCFEQFGSKGNDNDVHDIQSKCSFSSTSYNAMATGSASCGATSSSDMGMGMGVMSSTSVVSTTDSAGSMTASTSTAMMTDMTSASMGDMTSGSATPAQQTGNAAVVRGVGSGLGVAAGLAGLAGLF
ncbi:hypothetical protein Slin15195_G038370 [Septoria linicola]|uniref:Uncharacterized protein n=1 Tax=Septoria linicola TaxID=215465 RepID=A0A9Q9AQU1_9PEZI|nr:hypothetical protein Slin14017_G119770 [Septoria linicola]USW50518.1 hypothetical protein Slin15195_G038370 [Septoria linicola]